MGEHHCNLPWFDSRQYNCNPEFLSDLAGSQIGLLSSELQASHNLWHRRSVSHLDHQADSYITETTWTIYIQDEVHLADPLSAFLTARVNRHPLTDFNAAWRASLLYHLLEDHVLWTQAGRTFRDPIVTESHLDLTIPTTATGVSQKAFSSEDMSPEVLHSYEVGYRGLWINRLKTEATLFYYDAKDLRSFFIGKGAPVVPVRSINSGSVYTIGCELSTEVKITPWMGNMQFVV